MWTHRRQRNAASPHVAAAETTVSDIQCAPTKTREDPTRIPHPITSTYTAAVGPSVRDDRDAYGSSRQCNAIGNSSHPEKVWPDGNEYSPDLGPFGYHQAENAQSNCRWSVSATKSRQCELGSQSSYPHSQYAVPLIDAVRRQTPGNTMYGRARPQSNLISCSGTKPHRHSNTSDRPSGRHDCSRPISWTRAV